MNYHVPSQPTSGRSGSTLYFLPIKARVPLKFGPEITTEVTCARVQDHGRGSPRQPRIGLG